MIRESFPHTNYICRLLSFRRNSDLTISAYVCNQLRRGLNDKSHWSETILINDRIIYTYVVGNIKLYTVM